jgi:hypothetical protein
MEMLVIQEMDQEVEAQAEQVPRTALGVLGLVLVATMAEKVHLPQEQTTGPGAVAERVQWAATVSTYPMVELVGLDYNPVSQERQHTMLEEEEDQVVVLVVSVVVEQQQHHILHHQLVVHQTRVVVVELDLVTVLPVTLIMLDRLVVQE